MTSSISYAIPIRIGTPSRSFLAHLSLHSSDFTVPLATCSSLCKGFKKFSCKYSSTCTKDFEMREEYRSHDMQLYYTLRDTVKLGTVKIKDQLFQGKHNITNYGLNIMRIGTTIGLGPHEGVLDETSIVDSISYRSSDYEKVFGLILDTQSTMGELTIGSKDFNYPNLFLVEVPIIFKRYWVIRSDYLIFNQSRIGNNLKFGLDIEQEYIWVSFHIYSMIKNHVHPYIIFSNPDWIHINCSQTFLLPNLTFNFKGVNLTLRPTDYIIKSINSICFLAFIAYPANVTNSIFILGTRFLQRFYSFFDLKHKTVSFAYKSD